MFSKAYRILERIIGGLKFYAYIKPDPLVIISSLPPRRIFGKILHAPSRRLIILRNGLKFLFSTYPTLIEILVGKSYFYHKDFIPEKGKIIFDVGAYVGHYSILAAYLGSYVYAFEPIESNYKRLLLHIIINKNLLSGKIIPTKIALGEKEGEAYMVELDAGSYISRNEVINIKQKKKVKITTLDNFVDTKNIQKIDILKIDVEGYELEVLKGAKKCLERQKIRSIISSNYHYPKEEIEVTNYLKKFGYKKVLTTPGPPFLGGGVSYYTLAT